MELIEKKLRDTPEDHKKYLKRLSEYIRYLIENGRILEAKHFFNKLQEVKPSHIKTIILGYELAIKTFDNESVVLFDRALYDSKHDEELLLRMRLKYYYSVNNEKQFTDLVEYLLFERSIKTETFHLIGELVITQNTYKPISILVNYLKSKNQMLHKQVEGRVRGIVLQKLADTLAESRK
ncbi:hypothetical protein K0I73_01205 [Shewanella mesophila]|uniref:hypothetical protein n=1 Tax=Shewanella mesophila TaxID=2864208 RepID=UPI001C65F9EB|nr:hypothetical protein [Shewanella mesophila]QYJ86412.1 hypothetical protein K0I73_01205 [Shewanella mesophila]